MAVRVNHKGDEDIDLLPRGAGFRTEEDFNNLEVQDSSGSLIAAYAGGEWISAVIVDESQN
jgi:hypothetical protein